MSESGFTTAALSCPRCRATGVRTFVTVDLVRLASTTLAYSRTRTRTVLRCPRCAWTDERIE